MSPIPEDQHERLVSYFWQYDILFDKVALISTHESMDEYVNQIAEYLGIKASEATRTKFACGESYICFEESVRNKSVYFFVPATPDVNSRIMELLFFIDAAKDAEAEDINIIMPCLPYARQDRRNDKREHIATRVLASCIDALKGSNRARVITLDLHSPQIESTYRDTHIEPLRVNQLFGLFINDILAEVDEEIVMASPDFGGIKRLEKLVGEVRLHRKNISLAFAHKKREKHNEVTLQHVVGDVNGKHVILIDDMVDTGGTLIKSAEAMKNKGATGIDIFATHGYLNDPAIERFANAQKKGIIRSITLTDSIKLSEERRQQIVDAGLNIHYIPTTILFADVIARIQRNITLSPLYVNISYLENLYGDIELEHIKPHRNN
jgi:ribose-phosphate pyrophosphokinase